MELRPLCGRLPVADDTFWVLMRIYTLQRVWRRVVAACAVIDIAGASDVAATGDTVSAFGEGLADGLDFGL